MYYSERFIISGGIFEYYKYERIISDVRTGSTGGRTKGENTGKYRAETFNKDRKMVRRLINCNIHQWTDEEENRLTSKFLTLTFAANVTDLKYANREFAKFIQRLSYDIAYKIKYIAVMEFQKRGAVHYHAVIFNMPYKPANELQRIWGHGFVKVNKIEGVTNVGAYVCKYMTKSDDDRLKGQKMYLKSTGLLEPEDVKDYAEVQQYKKGFKDDKPTFETEFEAPFIGKIQYAQYNIDKIAHERWLKRNG